jgi:hypothetical protein
MIRHESTGVCAKLFAQFRVGYQKIESLLVFLLIDEQKSGFAVEGLSP